MERAANSSCPRRAAHTPVRGAGSSTLTIWSAREVEEERRGRGVEEKVALVLAVVAVIVVVVTTIIPIQLCSSSSLSRPCPYVCRLSPCPSSPSLLEKSKCKMNKNMSMINVIVKCNMSM